MHTVDQKEKASCKGSSLADGSMISMMLTVQQPLHFTYTGFWPSSEEQATCMAHIGRKRVKEAETSRYFEQVEGEGQRG